MWREFKNKIVIKEDLNRDNVEYNNGRWNGNIRKFNIIISEKVLEPVFLNCNYNYDYDFFWCSRYDNGDVKNWFKIVDEFEYEVDISKESYKDKGTEIANSYAKNMKKQLFFTIESTIENEIGLRPVYYKNKSTKIYK